MSERDDDWNKEEADRIMRVVRSSSEGNARVIIAARIGEYRDQGFREGIAFAASKVTKLFSPDDGENE